MQVEIRIDAMGVVLFALGVFWLALAVGAIVAGDRAAAELSMLALTALCGGGLLCVRVIP